MYEYQFRAKPCIINDRKASLKDNRDKRNVRAKIKCVYAHARIQKSRIQSVEAPTRALHEINSSWKFYVFFASFTNSDQIKCDSLYFNLISFFQIKSVFQYGNWEIREINLEHVLCCVLHRFRCNWVCSFMGGHLVKMLGKIADQWFNLLIHKRSPAFFAFVF